MGIDLKDILAGIGMGSLHERDKDLIDDGRGGGIDQVTQIKTVAVKSLGPLQGPENFPRNLTGTGSADAQDANASLADRRGHGGDGVIK